VAATARQADQPAAAAAAPRAAPRTRIGSETTAPAAALITPFARKIAYAIVRVRAALFRAVLPAVAARIEIAATAMGMGGEVITMAAVLIEGETEALVIGIVTNANAAGTITQRVCMRRRITTTTVMG
jgi:hypothetical protein